MATNAPAPANTTAAPAGAPAGAAAAAAAGGLNPRPCIFFRKGHCRAGAECKWSHAAVAPKKPPQPRAAPAGAAGAPAAAGAAGAAAAAPRPRADPKVTPCKFFARGTCRSGNDCQFIHSADAVAKQPRPQANAGAGANAPAAAGAAGGADGGVRRRTRRRGARRPAGAAGAAAAGAAAPRAAQPAANSNKTVGGPGGAAAAAAGGERQMSAARAVRKAIADDTMKILQGLGYKTESGKTVDLKGAITGAVGGAKLYKATDNPVAQWAEKKVVGTKKTKIEIFNATTLGAAKKLVAEVKKNVVALNFASAKHPGGGFQSGAQAQEESLARSSALYQTLTTPTTKELYDTNTAAPNKGLYSHAAIYSPNVPVFRGDDNKLLEEPFNVSFITCPAVNAGVASRGNRTDGRKAADGKDGAAAGAGPGAAAAKPAEAKDKETLKAEAKKLIAETMLERIDRILAIALLNGNTHIVLGAYGCGVFRNNANDVAGYFRQLLTGKGKYANQFEHIVFAVVEDRQNNQPKPPAADKPAAAADAKAAPAAAAPAAAGAGATDAKAAPKGDGKEKAKRESDKPRESKLAVFIEKFKDALTSPPPVLVPAAAAAPAAAAPAAAAKK